MSVTVVDHALAGHLLAQIRNEGTPPPVFRTLAKRLALTLASEAIRDLPTAEITVRTPLEETTGRVLGDLVAVPILRAGLGMLEAVTELFPEVAVGYIGLERDEASLEPQSYYRKLPPVRGRHVLVLDPMLATGGSGSAATAAVREGGPASIRCSMLSSTSSSDPSRTAVINPLTEESVTAMFSPRARAMRPSTPPKARSSR